MNELAAMIQDLTKIAKLDAVDMRTELGYYVRELERRFEQMEREAEKEFDNYPI